MVQITDPNAAAYGIWTPGHVQAMARPTGNAGADILNRMAMGAYARQEQGGYSDALAATQQAQLQAAAMEQAGQNARAYITAFPQAAAQGVAGAFAPEQFGIQANMPYITEGDVIQREREMAAGQADRASAFADAARYGVFPAEQEMAPYLGMENAPREGVMTPDAQTERIRAEAYAGPYAEAAQKTADAAGVRAQQSGQARLRWVAETNPAAIQRGQTGRWEVSGDDPEEVRRLQQEIPNAPVFRNAPPAAIQALRQNPSAERRAQYDEMYGPGSAARILGRGN